MLKNDFYGHLGLTNQKIVPNAKNNYGGTFYKISNNNLFDLKKRVLTVNR